MEIVIREYQPHDAAQLVGIFRDSYGTLRRSRGGQHPDHEVDKLIIRPDSEILAMLERGSEVLVAEVRGTGELAGTAAFTTNLLSRILNSTYSRNHYVKEAFQKGRAGVSVGSLLRRATIERARARGFRKMYGFSSPEAEGFHRKFGFRFVPGHDYNYLPGVEARYYELELNRSALNRLPLEPWASHAIRLCVRLKLGALALASGKKGD